MNPENYRDNITRKFKKTQGKDLIVMTLKVHGKAKKVLSMASPFDL